MDWMSNAHNGRMVNSIIFGSNYADANWRGVK